MTAAECETGIGSGAEEGGSVEQKKPRVDWLDPQIPIGNAPPLPWWPLAVSAVAWLAWLGFLGAMLLSPHAALSLS